MLWFIIFLLNFVYVLEAFGGCLPVIQKISEPLIREDWFCLIIEPDASLLVNDKGEVSKYQKVTVGFDAKLFSNFSLHGSGYQSLFEDVSDGESYYAKSTEYLFLQIGTPGRHRFRLLAGRYNPRLGLNMSVVMPVVTEVYSDREFLDMDFDGSMTLIVSDLVSTRLDLSVSEHLEKRIVTGTLVHDWSALDGMRLVLTYQGRPLGASITSVGFLNIAPHKGRTAFEWVRLSGKQYSLMPYGFKQLIRINYLGRVQKGGRWLFEYEDDVNSYYRTVLGHEVSLFSRAFFRVNVGYYKSRFSGMPNHWLSVLGIKVDL